MRILKFTLLDEGEEGIVVESKEYFASDHWVIVDDVKRTRRIMISEELKTEIKKLKYFFLNLTGHWIPPYSKFYDAESGKLLDVEGETPSQPHLLVKDIWNKVSIVSAKLTGSGFILSGVFKIIGDKPITVHTAFITEDDDIGFYTECVNVIEEISDNVIKYLKKQTIPIEEAKAKIPIEEAEGKTIDELTQLVAENFEKKGAIIMMDANTKVDSLPENTGKSKTVLNTGTGSIDGKNIEDAESADEGEKDVVQSVKKKEPFGKPASDSEFNADLSKDTPKAKRPGEINEGGDMGGMEHSENVDGGSGNAKPEQEEEW